MTDMAQHFLAALDVADREIHTLAPDQWTRPSPCSEWDARGVLVHITGTLRKVGEMLGDKAAYAAEPAAGAAQKDPQDALAAWDEQARDTRAALASADLSREVDTPLGRVPRARGLTMPTADLAVHAWDIAAAAGHALELPSDLVDFVNDIIATVPPHARGAFFDAPVQPAPGASPTERLMAELGRSRP